MAAAAATVVAGRAVVGLLAEASGASSSSRPRSLASSALIGRQTNSQVLLAGGDGMQRRRLRSDNSSRGSGVVVYATSSKAKQDDKEKVNDKKAKPRSKKFKIKPRAKREDGQDHEHDDEHEHDDHDDDDDDHDERGDVGALKVRLLSMVAGTDRGFAADSQQRAEVEEAALTLEAIGGGINLPDELPRLDGMWRLVYTSSFATGSLGGARPGPLASLVPFTLGQVFQKIDASRRRLDNIVELKGRISPALRAQLSLEHRLQISGRSGIVIVFDKTSVKGKGALASLPDFEVPSLLENIRAPSGVRSGSFIVTYVDDELRVTRGDRGELRVFVKA